MDTNRVVTIVLSELSTANLKLQENLEFYINQSDPIDSKVYQITTTLRKLAINELMITKFQALVTPNNTTQTTQDNGKV